MDECIMVFLFASLQIVNEPYVSAFIYGPDSKQLQDASLNKMQDDIDKELEDQDDNTDLPLAFDTSICSYDWVKKTLEADYPGKKLVFCKDMVTALNGKYHVLPKGFRHTIIIRDPTKMFFSLRKMVITTMAIPEEQQEAFRLTDFPPEDFPPKYQFGEMVDMMYYLKENDMESNPIVIDSDDLQNSPESILRQYFEVIGIPFSKDLLKWKAGEEITKSWIAAKKIIKMNQLDRGGFYGKALTSSEFGPSAPAPDKSKLTPDVIKCAEEAQKYYKELYDMRIKP